MKKVLTRALMAVAVLAASFGAFAGVSSANELAFTGSSSTVGTLLGAALLLMGAAALFFGRRKATD